MGSIYFAAGVQTISSVMVLTTMLSACSMEGGRQALPNAVGTPTPHPSPTELPPPEDSQITVPDRTTVSGWFSIIWNDEAHYFITDDAGNTIEVLLEEDLMKPLGGPLALDRTRVTIEGVIMNDPPILHAESIASGRGD
jgi:hypothetical protein